MPVRQLPVIVGLGTTQTLAWASSYYLPAILADPIARDLGVSSNWVFGAFSASLVISALLGPAIGRTIDRIGGRRVLSLSNLILAAGLTVLGLATSIWILSIAWLLLGIGMGLGLYDAAFAALGRIYGHAARSSITGITLFAGFASTVGWPLTALGLDRDRLARDLLRLGGCAPADRPADQSAGAARFQGGSKDSGETGQAAHSDRPRHDPARVRLCLGLERHRRDGRASASHSRGSRCKQCPGGDGRRADRPGAGDRPDHRGDFSKPLSSPGLDAARLPDASGGRGHSRADWRQRGRRVCDLPWRRQRHPDHCARHPCRWRSSARKISAIA